MPMVFIIHGFIIHGFEFVFGRRSERSCCEEKNSRAKPHLNLANVFKIGEKLLKAQEEKEITTSFSITINNNNI